jgi:opacity protein-like surface antigen
MNKKYFLLVAVVLALFLIPLTGFADNGKFGLGGHVGINQSNDAQSTLLYAGIHARWNLFPALSIEGAFDYRPSESYPNNKKVTNYPILVSALFYLIPGAKFSPYLLGGIGWYYSQIEDSAGTNTTYTPGLHLGAGLDIPINPDVVFHADIRYFFLEYGDQKVKNLDTNGYMINAGLTFYLW